MSTLSEAARSKGTSFCCFQLALDTSTVDFGALLEHGISAYPSVYYFRSNGIARPNCFVVSSRAFLKSPVPKMS